MDDSTLDEGLRAAGYARHEIRLFDPLGRRVYRLDTGEEVGIMTEAKVRVWLCSVLILREKARADEIGRLKGLVTTLQDLIDEARVAVGPGWFRGGESLAEAIKNKTRMLEREAEKSGAEDDSDEPDESDAEWERMHMLDLAVRDSAAAWDAVREWQERYAALEKRLAEALKSREKAARAKSDVVMTLDRCGRCGWPMEPGGCEPGDCSYRPPEGSDEWARMRATDSEGGE